MGRLKPLQIGVVFDFTAALVPCAKLGGDRLLRSFQAGVNLRIPRSDAVRVAPR
jgi:hypothetical protein